MPTSWAEAAPQVDEIWACSEFAARHIRAATDARVLAVLHPLATTAPPPAPAQRTCVFRVLVIFDYLSTLERKNPLGAIAAYRRAFAPSDGAQLVVKSMNGAHRPERRGEVELAAAGRDDILLRDETISSAERDALVESCDCLLSLHRSEGFGLALAEAMAAGKPVVATAYGGQHGIHGRRQLVSRAVRADAGGRRRRALSRAGDVGRAQRQPSCRCFARDLRRPAKSTCARAPRPSRCSRDVGTGAHWSPDAGSPRGTRPSPDVARTGVSSRPLDDRAAIRPMSVPTGALALPATLADAGASFAPRGRGVSPSSGAPARCRRRPPARHARSERTGRAAAGASGAA